MTVDLGLGLRRENADINAVRGMLIAGFGKDGGKTGRRGGKARLKQSAVEGGRVGNEKTEVA